MDSILIFLPINIKKVTSGYLLGFYKEDKSLSKSIYVLGLQACYSEFNEYPSSYVIGFYHNGLASSKSYPKSNIDDVWLEVKCVDCEISVEKCLVKKKQIYVNNVILVQYDSESFNKSELLLHPQNAFKIDHFNLLAKNLQLKQSFKKSKLYIFCESPLSYMLVIFSKIFEVLFKFFVLVRHSTLATHFKNYLQSIVWIGQAYNENKCINLKIGNYIMSVILDILVGLLVYNSISNWKNTDEIFNALSYFSENVIDSIIHLVEWLKGSPAGLKLNQPLGNILGDLVFYYLEIWRNFLGLVRPVLEIYFFILVKFGFLGLTFQLAMCADIFSIISFHVYCIYVYAARLFEVQAKGICSLSRLVLGRKRNPEPGKIDSCPYSNEELLIGTISFAVLLFLLPTTLVFYIVFTGMRIGAMLIKGFMIRTMYFMQTLPVYSTFLWIFFPDYTSTTVKLTPIYGKNPEHCCLLAKLTNSSWFETIKHSIPDAVPPPPPLTFAETLSKIVVGKII